MRAAALVVVSSALLTGCTARAPAEPDPRDIAMSYRSLRPMTQGPVLVDQRLAMLCRGVTFADVEKARESSGPHGHTAVRIFMNDAAIGVFGDASSLGNGTRYPAGAIIVKEKQAQAYLLVADASGPTKDNDGVGGMIKRAPGYDPANGDWEYFYFEDPSAVESGRIASCIACHRRAADRDFVFGEWSRGFPPQGFPRTPDGV